MKTALAIVCSFLLIWTQLVPAQSAAGVARAKHACCKCKAACCAAHTLPEPPPVSAAPVSSSFQNQLVPSTQAAIAWTSPAPPAFESACSFSSPLLTAGVPLFARNCSFLI